MSELTNWTDLAAVLSAPPHLPYDETGARGCAHFFSAGMSSLFCQASGIIMRIASGKVRPPIMRSSSTLSRVWESEPPGSMIGQHSCNEGSVGTRSYEKCCLWCYSEAYEHLQLWKIGAADRSLACALPILITTQRVDLAVVANVAIGMRTAPTAAKYARYKANEWSNDENNSSNQIFRGLRFRKYEQREGACPGKVLVAKREWTRATCDSKSGSFRSRKYSRTCSDLSIPL